MAHPDTGAGVSSSPASDADAGPSLVPGDVHSRLMEILDDDERFDAPPPPAPPAEDDADGEQDAPADEAGQDAEPDAEPGDAPAIEPPVSWKAEHKALFAELPPELQQVVAEREAERERAFQAKATEAANARRAAYMEAEQVARSQLAEVAERFEQQLATFMGQPLPAPPDPRLLDDDPAEFQRQKVAYDDAIAQRQMAQRQASEAYHMRQQIAAEQRQQKMAQDFQVLAEKLPGWADDQTRPQIAQALTEFATAHGFAERLPDADATDLLFLHQTMDWKSKAEKWDAYQAQKMQAVRAAKELPKVIRPGAAQPQGSAQKNRVTQHREALSKTGKVEDAARLIANFIE